MQIRAAELTADHLGRTVRIDPGDPSFVVGRLVKIRQRQVGNASAGETETRLELELVGGRQPRWALTRLARLRCVHRPATLT